MGKCIEKQQFTDIFGVRHFVGRSFDVIAAQIMYILCQISNFSLKNIHASKK